MEEDSEDERDPDWLKEKTVKVGQNPLIRLIFFRRLNFLLLS